MADQTQINPFVQQYGQLRLAPIDQSKVQSAQQAIEGSKPAGGPAATPGTAGVNDKASGAVDKAVSKANAKGQTDSSGSVLPWLAGAVGVGGTAAAAYALSRMKGKGGAADPSIPEGMFTDVGKGGLPDAITRPNWRYAGVQTDPTQIGNTPEGYLTNGQTTQPNGRGLVYNPRGQGQRNFPPTPETIVRPGAPQTALPNPNAQPTGTIYAGQGEQPLMLTDQNAAGRARAAEFARAHAAQKLGNIGRVVTPTPAEIQAITRIVK